VLAFVLEDFLSTKWDEKFGEKEEAAEECIGKDEI
jgi:hypothetical protein